MDTASITLTSTSATQLASPASTTNSSNASNRSSSVNSRTRRASTGSSWDRCFELPCFHQTELHAEMLGPMPESTSSKRPKPPASTPSYLAHLWSVPLMSLEQEQHCFRRLNLLKFLAAQQECESRRCRGSVQNRLELQRLEQAITQARNQIVESNLRLVVSIAKKYSGSGAADIDDLVGVGNEALVRAVDWFDYRRGIRFSTYAYQAIVRSIYQLMQRERRAADVFIADGNEASESATGDAAASDVAEIRAREAQRSVRQLMTGLSERDRQIVLSRFGFNRDVNTLSFSAIAEEIGVSKTRVAQLYHRSMQRLRMSAIENGWLQPEETVPAKN